LGSLLPRSVCIHYPCQACVLTEPMYTHTDTHRQPHRHTISSYVHQYCMTHIHHIPYTYIIYIHHIHTSYTYIIHIHHTPYTHTSYTIYIHQYCIIHIQHIPAPISTYTCVLLLISILCVLLLIEHIQHTPAPISYTYSA
jgi:hypothetical protein